MPARRRSPNNPSADDNPKLLVSVQEAREALEATIAEGNTLLAISISDQAEFDAAKSKKYTWGEYNLALLGKLFSTDTLVREYRGLAIGGGGSLSLTEETTFLRRDVQSDVRTLESVVNRLKLYQDPTIEIAAAPAPAGVAGRTSEAATQRINSVGS